MTLTPRYRLGLALLAALAVTDLFVWLFVLPARRGSAVAASDTRFAAWEPEAPPDEPLPGAATAAGSGLRGSGDGRPASSRPADRDGGPAPRMELVGARVELRAALGRQPTDWNRIREVLAARPDALDDELVETLLERFEEAPLGRGLVEAFAEARHPKLFDELLAIAEEQLGRGTLGQMALEALGALPDVDPSRAVDAIAPHLGDDPREDAPWLTALARLGGEPGLATLVQYLARSDHPERIPQSAVQGLRVADRAAAGRVLAEAFEAARSDDERAVLALVAGAVKAEGLEPRLVELLTSTEQAHVATNSARALAEQRTASAVDALVRVGRSDGPGAPQARSALNQMRGGEIEPDALDRLRDLLREDAPSATTIMVQGIAMGVLGAQGDLSSLPLVGERVAADDEAVAAPAITALGAYGAHARGEVGRLVARFDRSSAPVQASIVQALGRIGGGDAVEALRGWSESSSTPATLRNHILHALRGARTVGGP
ncbi:MAG: hypothetical protein AB7T63_07600 [Planctomycetota bacterium]